ncbi:MAG: hypothetical protein IPH78_07940 [Bacteroidetes bacterium]|nr:hypothetical protein [Bacteroidota bacterium]
MNKLLGLLVLILSTCGIQAQDVWETYFQDSQLKVEFRYADCHDEANGIHQQKVLLRFLNLTKSALEVSYQRKPDYGEGYTSETNLQHIRLGANAVMEGSCTEKDKSLFLFRRHLNRQGRSLQRFELANIQAIIVK